MVENTIWSPPCHALDFIQAHLKISGVYHKTGRPMPSQIPQPLAEQGFDTWHKSATMWTMSWCLSHWETHDNPTYGDIKEAFLVEEWSSFHLSREKQDFLTSHPNDFLKYEYELYLKQPMTQPQCKIIVAYHTSNRKLVIEFG